MLGAACGAGASILARQCNRWPHPTAPTAPTLQPPSWSPSTVAQGGRPITFQQWSSPMLAQLTYRLSRCRWPRVPAPPAARGAGWDSAEWKANFFAWFSTGRPPSQPVHQATRTHPHSATPGGAQSSSSLLLPAASTPGRPGRHSSPCRIGCTPSCGCWKPPP